MNIRATAGLILALGVPSHAFGQEAYMAQIQAGPATISVPAPAAAPAFATVMAGLDTLSPDPAPASLDLRDTPLVGPATDAALATIDSTGDGHSGLIHQAGLHAASIVQTGRANTASISQGGSGHRASIYQASSGGLAAISQSGTGNRALIVQR